MGDRVLYILTNEYQSRFSPVVYEHWGGSAAPERIQQLAVRMKGREGDPDYAAARLVGLAHEAIGGNLSLGIWNLEEGFREALQKRDREALAEFSHGDAGIVLIDCRDFSWEAFCGYLDKGD